MDFNNYFFKDIRDYVLVPKLDTLSRLCLRIALTKIEPLQLSILQVLYLGKYKNLYTYFENYKCEFPDLLKQIINIPNDKILTIKNLYTFIMYLYIPINSLSNLKFGNIKRGKFKYDNRLKALAIAASGYNYTLYKNPFRSLYKTCTYNTLLLLFTIIGKNEQMIAALLSKCALYSLSLRWSLHQLDISYFSIIKSSIVKYNFGRIISSENGLLYIKDKFENTFNYNPVLLDKKLSIKIEDTIV